MTEPTVTEEQVATERFMKSAAEWTEVLKSMNKVAQKKTQHIYIFHHKGCADGIMAFVAYTFAVVSLREDDRKFIVHHMAWTPGASKARELIVEDMGGKEKAVGDFSDKVAFVDCSPTEEDLHFLLSHFSSEVKIEVFDHHGDQSWLKRFERVDFRGGEGANSGAMIAYQECVRTSPEDGTLQAIERYTCQSSFILQLCQAVSRYDTWHGLKSKVDVFIFKGLIALYDEPIDLLNLILQVETAEQAQRIYATIIGAGCGVVNNQQRIADTLLDETFYLNMSTEEDGPKIPCVIITDPAVTNEVLEELKHEEVTPCCSIRILPGLKKLKLSFRGPGAQKYALMYGGGGHAESAGAWTTNEDYKKIMERIKEI